MQAGKERQLADELLPHVHLVECPLRQAVLEGEPINLLQLQRHPLMVHAVVSHCRHVPYVHHVSRLHGVCHVSCLHGVRHVSCCPSSADRPTVLEVHSADLRGPWAVCAAECETTVGGRELGVRTALPRNERMAAAARRKARRLPVGTVFGWANECVQ